MNNWLQDSGSLTARLRLCCQQFRVQLLNTRADVPFTASQARRLGDTHGYCREVLLLCDEQPWIYASSLYSSAALKAVPALGGLGQQALGELLFDNPQLVRGAFEFAQLTALEFRSRLHSRNRNPLQGCGNPRPMLILSSTLIRNHYRGHGARCWPFLRHGSWSANCSCLPPPLTESNLHDVSFPRTQFPAV